MTEQQQYRVIADRDKGDNPYAEMREPGDRVTYGNPAHIIVRIERPVTTEHCLSTAQHDGHEWAAHEGQPGTGYWCPGFDAADEHPPTREQIADAIWKALPYEAQEAMLTTDADEAAEAVLALIQNGADR